MANATAPSPASRRGVFETELAAYRAEVLPVLQEAIPLREPRRHLYDLIAGQLAREGKGIRPALCIATCRALGGRGEEVLPSAAALELLHNAFLVHDDIEDESEFRRDRPTLHRQYGLPLAVNTGDAMNALSLSVLKRNVTLLGPPRAIHIFDEFDHMMIETIEGQAMELGWIRDNDCDTTEADYLEMVLKKTCWYSFIHPCRIGAFVAEGDGADYGRFNRFGYFLGTAFQIQDDVLNLVGDRRKYGKEIGGDLLEGKRTLLLAHLFKHASVHQKERLRAFFAKPRKERLPREVNFVFELLQELGSIEYGRAMARQFAEAAEAEFIQIYRDIPPSKDLNFLRALVDYTVTREA